MADCCCVWITLRTSDRSFVRVDPASVLVEADVELPLVVVHPLVAEEGVVPLDVVVARRVDVVARDARVGPQVFVPASARGGAGAAGAGDRGAVEGKAGGRKRRESSRGATPEKRGRAGMGNGRYVGVLS